jgi:hypothetical protein
MGWKRHLNGFYLAASGLHQGGKNTSEKENNDPRGRFRVYNLDKRASPDRVFAA